jgi:hypothetical protein
MKVSDIFENRIDLRDPDQHMTTKDYVAMGNASSESNKRAETAATSLNKLNARYGIKGTFSFSLEKQNRDSDHFKITDSAAKSKAHGLDLGCNLFGKWDDLAYVVKNVSLSKDQIKTATADIEKLTKSLYNTNTLITIDRQNIWFHFGTPHAFSKSENVKALDAALKYITSMDFEQ